MKNGQLATIICYHNASNVDIQFEDGTIIRGRGYQQFKNREVTNPNYTTANARAAAHIGESRIMSNGMWAKIVRYKNNEDVDVEFENGIVREHVSYKQFLSGKMDFIHQSKRFADRKEMRLGEKMIMHCGIECEIIEYNHTNDITIQFTDGTIVTNRCYKDFLKGAIPHPKRSGGQLNETKRMPNGMVATIIRYGTDTDIDVQFEDGTIRRHVEYHSFVNGRLTHPSETSERQLQNRVGEINQMRNGMMAEITQYNTVQDITVQFEDGAVIRHQRYTKFKNGCIPHPNLKYKSSMSMQEFAINYYLQQLGFCKIKQGEWQGRGFGRLELDFYHQEVNIAIEYDGAIHNKPGAYERDVRKNKKCKKLGVPLYRIRHPDCPLMLDTDSININLNRSNTICADLIDCGEELKTILDSNKIDYPKDLINFQRDKETIISEYNDIYLNYYSKERIGQTSYSNSAKQNMKIITYNSYRDIDVQFENGEIRQGVSYGAFKRGQICLPSQTVDKQKQTRVGEQRIMNNGMMATIIKYNSSRDIDVEFENGTISKNKNYYSFFHGNIDSHSQPTYLTRTKKRANLGTKRIGEQRVMNNGHNATITEYYSSRDMTVQFDNGCIRKHVYYQHFCKGEISIKNDESY